MKLLKEEYDNKLIDFLKVNKDLILKNNFDELYLTWYKRFPNRLVYKLTQILINANINPLLYMKSIYENMYYSLYIPTKINIPNNIIDIEAGAFEFSRNLTNLKLPETVESLGSSCFNNCNLINVILNNTIAKIPKNAFGSCKQLSNIIIGNNVQIIDDLAFNMCTNLTDILIPACVEVIGEYAFNNCLSLKSIKLNQGLRYIGDSAFQHCIKLKNLKIPKSVESIDINAFTACKNLTDIIFEPNSKIKFIGKDAFTWCNLTNITLPKSIIQLNENIIEESKLIIYEGSEEEWNKIDGSGYYKNYNISFLNK